MSREVRIDAVASVLTWVPAACLDPALVQMVLQATQSPALREAGLSCVSELVSRVPAVSTELLLVIAEGFRALLQARCTRHHPPSIHLSLCCAGNTNLPQLTTQFGWVDSVPDDESVVSVLRVLSLFLSKHVHRLAQANPSQLMALLDAWYACRAELVGRTHESSLQASLLPICITIEMAPSECLVPADAWERVVGVRG